MTSRQGTLLYSRNDHTIKKAIDTNDLMNHVSWKFQNSIRYFRYACIGIVWASGMEVLPWEIRLCDEKEALKRNQKTHLFVKFVNESTIAIESEELL